MYNFWNMYRWTSHHFSSCKRETCHYRYRQRFVRCISNGTYFLYSRQAHEIIITLITIWPLSYSNSVINIESKRWVTPSIKRSGKIINVFLYIYTYYTQFILLYFIMTYELVHTHTIHLTIGGSKSVIDYILTV